MAEKEKKNKKGGSDNSENSNVPEFQYLDPSKVKNPVLLNAVVDWFTVPIFDKKTMGMPETQYELAEKLGIDNDTVTNWKHLQGFWDEVTARSKSYFLQKTPEVLQGITMSGMKGSALSAKLFLQYVHGWSEKQVVEEIRREPTEEEDEQIATALKRLGFQSKDDDQSRSDKVDTGTKEEGE